MSVSAQAPQRMAGMFLAAAVAAAAGAADAQVAPPTPGALSPYRVGAEPTRLTIDISGARALPYAQANALKAAGLAQTAIDHQFARDGLVGSAGFLCGLQPGQNDTGGAAAHGFDPQGRFVGAKLRLAFR